MSDREKSEWDTPPHPSPQKALRFFSSRSLDKNYAESALGQEWLLCVTREVTVAIKSNYIIIEYPHYIIGGARVVQWWEHSPLTNIARLQIPASTPYVGWVLLLVFSLAPRGFFSGYSGFPLLSKTNISKFQLDQESPRRRTVTTWMCYL